MSDPEAPVNPFKEENIKIHGQIRDFMQGRGAKGTVELMHARGDQILLGRNTPKPFKREGEPPQEFDTSYSMRVNPKNKAFKKDSTGNVYTVMAEYYFNDQGEAIKEESYNQIPTSTLAYYQEQRLYGPEMPLQTIPNVNDSPSVPNSLCMPLDVEDYEKVNWYMREMSQGQFRVTQAF